MGASPQKSWDWCWLRRGVRGWDAFRGMLRPSPPASVCMTMGIDDDAGPQHRPSTSTWPPIWAEVGTSIEHFVRRRINDPHHAEDVVAEVMLRIHRRLGALDDHERVTAWVFAITRNAITDHYRRSGRRREVLAAEIEPVADPSADAWLDDQDATLSELAACIRPLVHALPPDYRRALELTDFDGRTQADAAQIEGISLSGMKSRSATRSRPVRQARQAMLRRHHRQPRRARRFQLALRRVWLPPDQHLNRRVSGARRVPKSRLRCEWAVCPGGRFVEEQHEGAPMRLAAMSIRRRMPPDRLPTRRSAMSAKSRRR